MNNNSVKEAEVLEKSRVTTDKNIKKSTNNNNKSNHIIQISKEKQKEYINIYS